jgi:hypothetical protein
MASDRKLQLEPTLAALDRKDRDYFDNLDEDQQKEFSGYLLLRYCSTLGKPKWGNKPAPDSEMTYYYLASTNHYANKHMFDLAKHKKLQWLMLTAASPGLGSQSHIWLKQKPKPKNANSGIKKDLADLFPAMKDDDLEVLSQLITKKELNAYIKDHGER